MISSYLHQEMCRVANSPFTVFMRIRNLVRKELIQLRRDWVMTAFILTLPVLQLILLAQATSSSISNLSVAVLDRDNSSASREIIAALDNRQELNVRRFPTTLEETRRLLDNGEATLAVVIPVDFDSERANRFRSSSIQLIVDASNDVVADVALGAARSVIVSCNVDEPRIMSQGDWASVIDLHTTVLFNSTFDVKYFTVPAQVGFIVYQVTLTVASIGLARERELGTLEQLIVMPLRRVELVIGKAIPALIVGSLNFLLMLSVAILGFHVPMRGGWALLLLLTLLFIIAEIGYGILISSVAHTQQQAILFVFVLAMMDMAFSGYLVRVKNLPTALQAIALIVPFRHYLTIIRGVMLKGAGLNALWPHAAAILFMGGLVILLAVHSLSRSLD